MAIEKTTILVELPKGLKRKARADGKARGLKVNPHIRKLIRDYDRKSEK